MYVYHIYFRLFPYHNFSHFFGEKEKNHSANLMRFPQPHVYISTGTHALYPTPGPHDHTIPNISLPFPLLLTDYTTATGPLYDPLLSSYFYTYNTTTSTFHPFTFPSSSPPAPTGFLNFTGRWGDAEYPTSDPRQSTFLFGRFKKYNGGPTGPKDKQLGRKEVWPQNADSKGQRLRGTLGVGFGKWVKGLFKGKGKK